MRQTVYVCTACGLNFRIGWVHGAPWERGARDKYNAATAQICKECGAQYEIEMAGPYRMAAYMNPLKDYGAHLPDRLFGLNRQIFLKGLPEKSPENYDDPDYEAAHEIINQYRGDKRIEWNEINPIETKYNQILFSKQPCQICLTVGKIGGNICTGDVCPHCKEKALLPVFSYLT
jgi:hypothetical protein